MDKILLKKKSIDEAIEKVEKILKKMRPSKRKKSSEKSFWEGSTIS